jgi:hypothetical protein
MRVRNYHCWIAEMFSPYLGARVIAMLRTAKAHLRTSSHLLIFVPALP